MHMEISTSDIMNFFMTIDFVVTKQCSQSNNKNLTAHVKTVTDRHAAGNDS